MRITVAVCTYNRFHILGKCLESLRKQTLPTEQYQILVVDNSLNPEASKEFRDSLTEFTNLKYMITDRAGIGYARTVAMNNCKTEFIAYTDDDCVVPSNWLENILATFDRYSEGVGGIGGSVEPSWEIRPPKWLNGPLLEQMALLDWGSEDCYIDTEVKKWLLTANAAYRMRALRAAGGFPTHLGRLKNLPFAHEELAANTAIQKLGYDLVYSPSFSVNHLVPAKRMTQKWICLEAFLDAASIVLMQYRDLGPVEMDEIVTSIRPKSEALLDKHTEVSDGSELVKEVQKYREIGRVEIQNAIKNISLQEEKVLSSWPVIYIVTPSLNAVETIDRTVLSVITQSGDFAIRYHIQDGGSTDGTLEKLETWKKLISDPNSIVQCKNVVFSYASASDEGMYDAICRGFASMYIPPDAFMTWINADDILMPHVLTTVDSISAQLPDVHWLGGTVTAFYTDERFMSHYPTCFPREVICRGLCDLRHWQTLQQEGMFWRKWVWDKVGGLNSRLKYAGDWDLWLRFAQYVDFVHVPWTLGVFHVRKGQLATTDDGKAYQQEIDSLLSLSDRRLALTDLTSMDQNGLFITELFVDFNSKKYSIHRQPLGERIPEQAKRYFKAEITPKDANKGNDSFGTRPSASLPKRPFFGSSFLKKILLLPSRYILGALTRVMKPVLLPMTNFLKKWHVYLVLLRSGLFFHTHYLKQCPDATENGINPIFHYILIGSKEGRNPNPLFDTDWYLKTYPDVAREGINPLFHYIKYGEKQGLDPGPKFSANEYLKNNADVRKMGISPLLHYLKYGAMEGRHIISKSTSVDDTVYDKSSHAIHNKTRFHGIIYDVGLHTGQDTEFYLKKGFRVIAIDANPNMVDDAKVKFSHYVAKKQLVLLNLGIVENPTRKKFKFYISENHTEWSSFIKEIATRDGGPYQCVEVQCATLEEIIGDYGNPYFVKIDIEGYDHIALKSLLRIEALPKYISVENGNKNMLNLLHNAGYSLFKYVQQNDIHNVSLPYPPKEGDWVDHAFPFGSSGPFGEETRGEWKGFQEVRSEISKVWDPDGESKNPEHDDQIHGWFDLHAKLL